MHKIIASRKRQDRLFAVLGVVCTLIGLATLAALLVNLAVDGLARINWQFLTGFPSRFAAKSGIMPAWVGSLLVMLVTMLTAVPVGVAAGIYLEEYARKNWLTGLIEINISNLAAVPSIIYGIMFLTLFVQQFGWGPSIRSAGLTLALLVLPIVVVATREALRSIPATIREAALALGATKWQTIRHHLLPYSAGGIATGIIIAMSRAVGETAPLITVGALAFIMSLPPSPIRSEAPYVSLAWLNSDFTVLPIQMFQWVSHAKHDFHINAAATGLVLVVLTLGLNAVAITIRYRMRRNIKW